jgi:hypothetical protein
MVNISCNLEWQVGLAGRYDLDLCIVSQQSQIVMRILKKFAEVTNSHKNTPFGAVFTAFSKMQVILR